MLVNMLIEIGRRIIWSLFFPFCWEYSVKRSQLINMYYVGCLGAYCFAVYIRLLD